MPFYFTAQLKIGWKREWGDMQQRATGQSQTPAAAARTQPLYIERVLYQLSYQRPPIEKAYFVKYKILECIFVMGFCASMEPVIYIQRIHSMWVAFFIMTGLVFKKGLH